MQQHSLGRTRRHGAAIVEFAFVAIIFFMFLFSILEWARFVFTKHVIDTAAREGARYAIVNTTDTTILPDTLAQVANMMPGYTYSASTSPTLPSYHADCFKCNSTTGANIGSANTAVFGECVAVQIDADFNPVLPTFVFFGNVPHIRSVCMMYSEAN